MKDAQTWPRLGVGVQTVELINLVLEVGKERDVDGKRDEREQSSKEGGERSE